MRILMGQDKRHLERIDQMKTKMLTIFAVSGFFLILVAAMTWFCFPYIYAWIHTDKIKTDLDNEIINQNYLNWDSNDLDQVMSIKLPEEWKILRKDGRLYFIDSEQIVAVGKRISSATDEAVNTFVADYYGCQSLEVEKEHYNYYFGNLSFILGYQTRLETQSEVSVLVLWLPYHYEYGYLFLLFDQNGKLPLNEACAIAWSLTYQS